MIQFKVLINRLLMTFACCHFLDRYRPEAPECWRHLNQAIWLKVCITHVTPCNWMLAKNNSRTKHLTEFTSSLTFSHISLSQKNHYKMKMILAVSKKAESSKKARGNPGTLTGVYVNSMAQVTSEHLTFRIRICHPVLIAWNQVQFDKGCSGSKINAEAKNLWSQSTTSYTEANLSWTRPLNIGDGQVTNVLCSISKYVFIN